MKGCTYLRDHPDWSNTALADSAAAEHLRRCPTCRAAVDAWRAVVPDIVAADCEAVGGATAAPSESAIEQMLVRARAARTPSKGRGALRWGAIGAAAACVLAVMVGFYIISRSPVSTDVDPTPAFGSVYVITEQGSVKTVLRAGAAEVTVPRGGRARAAIGKDVFGVDGGGRLRVEEAGGAETVVSLLTGTVSVKAARREEGTSLVVRAGRVRVRVVGTRFSVTRGPDDVTEVAVSEGLVEVSDGAGGRLSVGAGHRLRAVPGSKGRLERLGDADRQRIERLLSGAASETEGAEIERSEDAVAATISAAVSPDESAADAISADTGAAPARRDASALPEGRASRRSDGSLAKWRRWIIAGRIADAEAALHAYTKAHPNDIAAWSLLADCSRKRGDWEATLRSLGRVEALGRPADAARARFKAGAILQDRFHDHPAAAKKFERYLRTGGPLSAEASIRLAVSYIAMGKIAEARGLLERVAREHGGTTAAAKAQKMLREL